MRHHAAVVGLGACLALAMQAGAQPDVLRSMEPVVRYDGHRVVRVFPQGGATIRQYQTAMALTDDVWTHTPRVGQPLDMRVTPEQFAALSASGLPFVTLVENLQVDLDRESAAVAASRQQAMDGGSFYTSYKNYAEVRTYVQQLAAQYPGLAQYIVLGQSQQGREIFGLRITGPGSATGRPGALYHGCQHAREWITVPTTLYFGEQLLERYQSEPAIASLVNSVEFFIVPIVNPDGYDFTWTTNRLWRKNRQANTGSSCIGTDPNRNWGFQWGGAGASTNPCNDTFRGPSAFSAPETRVLRDFILARPNIRAHLDIHSYSQYIMWPWGYVAQPAPDQATFATIGSRMETAIESAFGTAYTAGAIYSILYPASGSSCDWVYGASSPSSRIWSLALELRPGPSASNGFVLPADQILPTAQETYFGILELSRFIAPTACYPNCDGSTAAPVLNALDFSCFLQRYGAGDPSANCDGSTAAPVLNALDFSCFLGRFASGCP